MGFFEIVLIVSGLILFEVISSIDNAIINAEVLSTMGKAARVFFLRWGLLIAVFAVRGLLPWLIVYATAPQLGFIGAFTATFSGDPRVSQAVELASPILLVGGGVFLVFLFLHWLFVEEKEFGLIGERFFSAQGVWFYSAISLVLAVVVWLALQIHPMMAFSAVIGSTAFFITHGFKQQAEAQERKLLNKDTNLSDASKVFYLEVIDATFSIDGVLGAFAFTLSVPLILIGNGIGALVLRQITIGNIERIKKYIFLKNGAMYSICILGVIMILDAFGKHIPTWVSPVLTFGIVIFFFLKSRKAVAHTLKPQ